MLVSLKKHYLKEKTEDEIFNLIYENNVFYKDEFIKDKFMRENGELSKKGEILRQDFTKLTHEQIKLFYKQILKKEFKNEEDFLDFIRANFNKILEKVFLNLAKKYKEFKKN